MLVAESNRVVFKDLKRRGGEGEAEERVDSDEGHLMVPSIKCTNATPAETEGGNVKPDSLVVAEVRVGDYVMLAGNNDNMSKMLGVGQGVDTLILLKTRAERQFVAKSMHKRVRGEKQESKQVGATVWNKVLECDPLRRLIRISVVPTATKKDFEKWCR